MNKIHGKYVGNFLSCKSITKNHLIYFINTHTKQSIIIQRSYFFFVTIHMRTHIDVMIGRWCVNTPRSAYQSSQINFATNTPSTILKTVEENKQRIKISANTFIKLFQ